MPIARKKLACMLAHNAVTAATAARARQLNLAEVCSAYHSAASRKTQLNTWGRASQWRLMVVTKGGASTAVTQKSPPILSCKRHHNQVHSATTSANSVATPRNPSQRCARPINTSDPHSHTYQGCPSFEKEYGSEEGNSW